MSRAVAVECWHKSEGFTPREADCEHEMGEWRVHGLLGLLRRRAEKCSMFPTLRGVCGQGKEFPLGWERSKHAGWWE